MIEGDLVTVGESFEDLVFFGLDKLPAPGEEVKTNHFSRTQGGGALIAAMAAARLGPRTSIISALSASAVEMLQAEEIAVRNLRRAHEPHAITVSISTKTDRSFVTFNGTHDLLQARMEGVVPSIRSRHAYFAFPPNNCAHWAGILQELQALGVQTSWDFGWNESLCQDADFVTLCQVVDYLFLNQDEALLYSGTTTYEDAAHFFRHHTKCTIIKRGALGAQLITRDGTIDAKGRHCANVVDTTGAGDAFNGGFLSGLLGRLTLTKALDLGNIVGAHSVSMPGGVSGLPRRSELGM